MYRFREESSLAAISKFWICKTGFGSALYKIPLANISAAEILFASILRQDNQSIRSRVGEELSESTSSELMQLVKATKFATMVLDVLSEGNLLSELPATFRRELSMLASREIATRTRANQKFAHLLGVIAKFEDQVLFLKGAGLSRTVYARPEHRNYSDLDVLVRISAVQDFISTLENFGFSRLNIPSDCNQVGAGPVADVSDLLLSPHPLFVPAAFISLMKQDWPVIDVKLSPIDRGIQVHEIDKFFADRLKINFEKEIFFVPSNLDHLIVSLHTLAKDGFTNWRTLFDIHLLSNKISEEPALWRELTRRCKLESMEVAAWTGLTLSSEHLKTNIPSDVLTSIAPIKGLARMTSFTLPTKFIWNSTSLPVMLLNALTSRDCLRRLTVLLSSLAPKRSFLMNYYNNRQELELKSTFTTLITHWIVLLFPGGLLRKTLGQIMWR